MFHTRNAFLRLDFLSGDKRNSDMPRHVELSAWTATDEKQDFKSSAHTLAILLRSLERLEPFCIRTTLPARFFLTVHISKRFCVWFTYRTQKPSQMQTFFFSKEPLRQSTTLTKFGTLLVQPRFFKESAIIKFTSQATPQLSPA